MDILNRLRKEIVDCEKLMEEELFVEEYNIWFESKKYIDNTKQSDLSRIGVGTTNAYRSISDNDLEYPNSHDQNIEVYGVDRLVVRNEELSEPNAFFVNSEGERIGRDNLDDETDNLENGNLEYLRSRLRSHNSNNDRLTIINTPNFGIGSNGRIEIGTPNSHDAPFEVYNTSSTTTINSAILQQKMRYFHDLIEEYLLGLKNFNKIKDYKIHDVFISYHAIFDEYRLSIPFEVIKKRLFFNKKIEILIRVKAEESDDSVIGKLNERMSENGIEC